MITARRVAYLLCLWGVLLLGVALVLYLTEGPHPYAQDNTPLAILANVAEAMALLLLGAFVVSRQPRNLIGWSFLAAGSAFAYGGVATQYVLRGAVIHPGSLPLVAWSAWCASWIQMLSIWLPILFVLYLFPTGRTLSPRWRVAFAIGVAAITVLALANAFGRYAWDKPKIRNPLHWEAFERAVTPLGNFLWLLPFISMAVGAISLLVRYHRARGTERQQLKWIALSGVFVLAGTIGLLLVGVTKLPGTIVFSVLIVVGMGSMPLTVSIAIARYRLYDVDRFIRRTVSYLIVTALLASLYAFVVLIPTVFIHTDNIPNAFVALGTLVAAMAFVPVRRRVQGAVDRRFNRSRYDAEATIDAFGSRLRLEVDLDAMGTELAGIVRQTMQPAFVGLWLRPR